MSLFGENTGMERMLGTVFKALGIDGVQVKAQVENIRNMVQGVDARLTRIETMLQQLTERQDNGPQHEHRSDPYNDGRSDARENAERSGDGG